MRDAVQIRRKIFPLGNPPYAFFIKRAYILACSQTLLKAQFSYVTKRYQEEDKETNVEVKSLFACHCIQLTSKNVYNS